MYTSDRRGNLRARASVSSSSSGIHATTVGKTSIPARGAGGRIQNDRGGYPISASSSASMGYNSNNNRRGGGPHPLSSFAHLTSSSARKPASPYSTSHRITQSRDDRDASYHGSSEMDDYYPPPRSIMDYDEDERGGFMMRSGSSDYGIKDHVWGRDSIEEEDLPSSDDLDRPPSHHHHHNSEASSDGDQQTLPRKEDSDGSNPSNSDPSSSPNPSSPSSNGSSSGHTVASNPAPSQIPEEGIEKGAKEKVPDPTPGVAQQRTTDPTPSRNPQRTPPPPERIEDSKLEKEITSLIHRDVVQSHLRVKWVRIYVNTDIHYDVDDEIASRMGFDSVCTVEDLKRLIRVYLTKKGFTILRPEMWTLDPIGNENLVRVESVRKIMFVYVREVQ